MGSVTQGADFSYCQTGCDYAQLAKAGVQFAWLKQMDWSPIKGFLTDSMFETHLNGMRGQGVYCGSYAFGHVTPDPIKFADAFADVCLQDELPPVLDMETLENGQVPSVAGPWAYTFLCRLEQDLKKTPALYSYTNYLTVIGKQAPGLSRFPVWIAEYHANSDNVPRMPAPWAQDRLIAFQWTGSGRLPGCPTQIDRDVLVWQLDDVLALCQSSSTSAGLGSGS